MTWWRMSLTLRLWPTGTKLAKSKVGENLWTNSCLSGKDHFGNSWRTHSGTSSIGRRRERETERSWPCFSMETKYVRKWRRKMIMGEIITGRFESERGHGILTNIFKNWRMWIDNYSWLKQVPIKNFLFYLHFICDTCSMRHQNFLD